MNAMIGFIYDDFLHIGHACHRLEAAHMSRVLIYLFHCYIASDAFTVRIFSLISIFLTAYTFSKILKELRVKMNIYFYIMILSHSVILFPFFYSSQISTSLTFLWAATTSYFILFKRNNIILFFLFLVGPFLRFESVYYLIINLGSIAILKYSIQINSDNLLRVFNKRQLTSIFIFISMFFLGGFLLNTLDKSFNDPTKVFTVYTDQISFFPFESHLFVQFYSLFLYFKNLFLPFDANFFYPWSHWVYIHDNIQFQVALAIFTCFVLVGSGVAFYIYKKKKSYKRFFYVGVFLFSSICLIVSIRARTDWYFQSRQYMASFFFLICFYLFLQHQILKYNKYKILLIAYLILSSLIQVFFHYSSDKTFAIWEYSKFEQTSPQVQSFFAPYVGLEDRLEMYLKATEISKVEYAQSSMAVRKHWLTSMVNAYIIAKAMNKEVLKKKIANLLFQNDSYLSTVVCLAEESIPLSKCTTSNRKANFCRAIRTKTVKVHAEIKLRKTVTDICSSS